MWGDLQNTNTRLKFFPYLKVFIVQSSFCLNIVKSARDIKYDSTVLKQYSRIKNTNQKKWETNISGQIKYELSSVCVCSHGLEVRTSNISAHTSKAIKRYKEYFLRKPFLITPYFQATASMSSLACL